MRPWFVDEMLIGYGCAYNKPACDYFMTYIASTTNHHSDYERSKIYFGHYPKGSSIRTWLYLYQQQKHKYLAEYDWGKEKNLRLYGTEQPPKIDTTTIQHQKVPIIMVVGKDDRIV
jgi:hypothetical protein